MGSLEDCILKRHEISFAYAASKNWDFDNLTLNQIIEIRSQLDWKDAGHSQHISK